MKVPVPTDKDVQDIVAGLLGLTVAVVPAEPLTLVTAAAHMTYATDANRSAVVALTDIGFLNRVGAALVRVPSAAAERSTIAGKLDSGLCENSAEVLNVLARLLNSNRSPHLRATSLKPLPGTVPGDVQAIDRGPAEVHGFELTVSGYGRGRLTLLYARAGTF